MISADVKANKRSNGVVVKALDSQSRGPTFKTTGCLQGQLSFLSFRGRQNGVPGISGKLLEKVNCLLEVALALRQVKPIHKKVHKVLRFFQQKQQEIKDLVTVYLTNFFKKYLQNLKYNVKRACVFRLILVGILSILMILSVKNMGWGFFCLSPSDKIR